MRIVVNADDFGLSNDGVRATFSAFEDGALTSATIMAGMPAAEPAVEFARRHPEWSFGIHLTFSGDGAERPLSDPASVRRLIRGDGAFPPANKVRLAAMLHRLPPDQIDREIEAQIAWLAERGLVVSHVDSHNHLHKWAPFQAALRRVLPRFGISRVRNVQDVYLRRPLVSPTAWRGRAWRGDLMRHFETTEHFYMPATTSDRAWLGLLERLPPGETLEIGVHPGFAENWRDEERRAAVAFAAAARSRGHELVGWREIG